MEENNEKKYSYNRIVIIGNGFDRAWGLKTSYADFILYFLKKSCINALYAPVSSELIKIDKVNYSNIEQITAYINNTKDINSLLESIKGITITISKKSELLNKIISLQFQENWVDIESLYFNLLLTKLDNIKKSPVLERKYDEVLSLNKQFAELQTELLEYLKLEDSTFKIQYDNNIMYDLIDELFKKDLRSKITSMHDYNSLNDPNEVLFLNFNYTNTLRKSLNATSYVDRKIINIHGNVNDSESSIIFGYGDDLHSRYKELEDEDNDHLLLNIKSFYYTSTYDYQELIDFILPEKYEVYIVGHSCGLSDRTLLKTIFEDSNCVLIKIYTHNGKDEHFKKSIAVSRHCENKPKIRHKIVPFDKFAKIPQKPFKGNV